MERLRSRRGWLILILIAAVTAILIGRQWLFAQAACPRLQFALLYAAAVLMWIAMTLYAIVTRNNAPIVQIATLGVVIVASLLVPSVAGSFLGGLPQVREVFCPSCDEILATVQELRDAGQIDGAEHLARQCLGENPAADSELARVLYEKAGRWIHEGRCTGVDTALAEAHTLASGRNDSDLVLAIEERQQNFRIVCATPTPILPPTVTPPPTNTPLNIQIEILRAQRTGDMATVDFRVLQAGDQLVGLPQSQFALSSAGETVPILAFEERGADDPVCMVVVVDNSGSIYPGRNQIRAAITSLNDKRKPDDELGLVVFTTHADVRVVQMPARKSLDPSVVTGVGERTALWDGVLAGLDTAQNCESLTRYLLVLTDGADNDSVILEGDNLSQARQIADRAKAANVGIFAVGVESEALEEGPLQLVAWGGDYRSAEDFDALVSLFQDIFGFVRNFYRIQFSADALSAERAITLRVMDAVEVNVDFSH